MVIILVAVVAFRFLQTHVAISLSPPLPDLKQYSMHMVRCQSVPVDYNVHYHLSPTCRAAFIFFDV